MLLRQISQSYLLAQWLNAAEGFFWNSEEAPNSRPNLKRVVIPFSSFHNFFYFRMRENVLVSVSKKISRGR